MKPTRAWAVVINGKVGRLPNTNLLSSFNEPIILESISDYGQKVVEVEIIPLKKREK